MDASNKNAKYCNSASENFSSKQKNGDDKDKDDDREILGVDDKLIGDDLEIAEVDQHHPDKKNGAADEGNIY